MDRYFYILYRYLGRHKNVVTTVVMFIASFFSTAFDLITFAISVYLGKLQKIIISVWDSIKSKVTTVINVVSSVISTVLNSIKTVFSTVWNSIKTTVTTVVNSIKTVITTVFNAIKIQL